MNIPAGVPLRADAGTGAPPPAPHAQGGGAADTIHVELAVWSGSYRIIQTRSDGRRSVWRRGIPTLDEARLRATIVADICGYEALL